MDQIQVTVSQLPNLTFLSVADQIELHPAGLESCWLSKRNLVGGPTFFPGSSLDDDLPPGESPVHTNLNAELVIEAWSTGRLDCAP